MIVYLLIHACLLFTYLFLANLNMEIFFLQVMTWQRTWAVVESYLGSKTPLVKTWTVIGESELVQLLINSYK